MKLKDLIQKTQSIVHLMYKVVSVKMGIELGIFCAFLYVTKHVFQTHCSINHNNDHQF